MSDDSKVAGHIVKSIAKSLLLLLFCICGYFLSFNFIFRALTISGLRDERLQRQNLHLPRCHRGRVSSSRQNPLTQETVGSPTAMLGAEQGTA